MNCLKCGEKIEHNQVFCPNCLAEMEHYPVKPDIVVQLPIQQRGKQPVAPQNAVRRQTMADMEAKCRKLKKANRVLATLMAIFILATLVLSAMTFNLIEQWGLVKKRGQNYTAISETVFYEPT